MGGDDEDPFLCLEATHIFPTSQVDNWNRNGLRDWITDTSAPSQIGSSGLHSPQNGLLLSSSVHHAFDAFQIGVDPDVSLILN